MVEKHWTWLFLVTTALLAGRGPAAAEDHRPGPSGKPTKIVASDYPSIQAAIDATKELGVYHVYIPSGVYVLDKPLNLTRRVYRRDGRLDDGKWHHIPLLIEGAGRSTLLVARTGDKPTIDLTGSMFATIRDLELRGEDAECGIFMARYRNPKPKGFTAPSAGWHHFINLDVTGRFHKAAVMSWDSEGNTFLHCRIRNKEGDAMVFSDYNRMGIASPYAPTAPSCNTVVRFFACGLMGHGQDSVALRLNGAGDVAFDGGYISTSPDAFAGIYMDGTHHCRNVAIRSTRMECKGRHCVYAVGAVGDVAIEGGQWISQRGEIIRHECRAPEATGPHRYVGSAKHGGVAYNWTIRNLRPSRNFPDDPGLKLQEGRFCAMRFESLLDSTIEHISFQSQYLSTDQDGKKTVVVATDIPIVEVLKYSRRNVFRVPSRQSVRLAGDARNNTIIATADGLPDAVPSLWLSAQSSWHKGRPTAPRQYDGMTRTYLNPDAGLSLLNLGVRNVYEVTHPKRGDLLLHDGTRFPDGKPRLAVYDGSQWLFFSPVLAPEK